MKALILSISLLFLVSCDKDLPSRQELMDEFYSSKVKALQERKLDDCLERVVMDAQYDLDSLFDRYVDTEIFDSTAFPAKPIRPQAPGHIIDKVDKFELEQN